MPRNPKKRTIKLPSPEVMQEVGEHIASEARTRYLNTLAKNISPYTDADGVSRNLTRLDVARMMVQEESEAANNNLSGEWWYIGKPKSRIEKYFPGISRLRFAEMLFEAELKADEERQAEVAL